jgi:hypothetical protein
MESVSMGIAVRFLENLQQSMSMTALPLSQKICDDTLVNQAKVAKF